MGFSADGIAANLQASFDLGGKDDLTDFVLRHPRARRWLIASDFNLGSPGAEHNVYAFAAYPVGTRGYFQIVERLKKLVPADFKRTRSISQNIRRFFDNDDCYCFVFLMPTKRMSFADHADHKSNLEEAHQLIEGMLQACLNGIVEDDTLNNIKKFCQETAKKNLSLTLLDQLLLFTITNAFVSFNVAAGSNAEHIGWFPDRDNMTTYADSAWSSLAFLSFHGFWKQRIARQPPSVGVIDHRVRGNNDVYDALIRVPDFLAATFSRWHLEGGKLSLPQGTSKAGGRRYKQIIRGWGADNKKLWIERIFRDENGLYRCARIAVTRSKKRSISLKLRR